MMKLNRSFFNPFFNLEMNIAKTKTYSLLSKFHPQNRREKREVASHFQRIYPDPKHAI